MRNMLANQATAARRRVYFQLVDVLDGMTPETAEAGGQPQVSTDGGAWTNTGIGTLVAIGNGRYYAELTQSLIDTAGRIIETRFKSANTAEGVGDSVHVVGYNPDDLTATLADAVWDEVISGHLTAGTTGATLNAAASTLVGSRQVTITVNKQGPAVLPGVTVDIYASDGLTHLRRVVDDDNNGIVVTNLNDGNYVLKALFPGFTPSPASTALVVDGTEAVTLSGTLLSAPSSANPLKCMVYGYAVSAKGDPIANLEIQFSAEVPQALTPNVFTRTSATATTTSGGYFEIELVRGARVKLRSGLPQLDGKTITVPAAASVEIATLI